MDVTIAAGTFPPRLAPRAIQNSRLINALGWAGHLIIPATQIKRTDRTIAETVPQGMRKHAIWPMRLSYLHSLTYRLGLRTGVYPDVDVLWSAAAGVRIATLPKSDLLLTISHPVSTHLAGLIARAIRGPSMPWIAIFSDPWTDLEAFGYISYTAVSRRFNRWLEAAVMRSVDAAVFTNSAVEKVFIERYPMLVGRTYVVSQAFDPQLHPRQPEDEGSRVGRPLLRYIGDFYKQRSPLRLLRVIDDYQRESGKPLALNIEFIGRMACEDQEACQQIAARWPNITFSKEVGYMESLVMMSRSDALIVLDAAGENSLFLPSKLCEYIGAGKPLIGFVPPGPSAEVIGRAGGIVADLADSAAVLSALQKVVQASQQKQLHRFCPTPDVRESFDIAYVAKSFACMATNVMNGWPAPSGLH